MASGRWVTVAAVLLLLSGAVVVGVALVRRIEFAPPGQEDARVACSVWHGAKAEAEKVGAGAQAPLLRSVLATSHERATRAAEKNADYRPLERALLRLDPNALRRQDIRLADFLCYCLTLDTGDPGCEPAPPAIGS